MEPNETFSFRPQPEDIAAIERAMAYLRDVMMQEPTEADAIRLLIRRGVVSLDDE